MTFVLVPERVDDTEAAVTKLLAPFDESLEIAYTRVDCPCSNGEPIGCKECHGTRYSWAMHNPLARWDWWEIGGSWEGLLPGDAISVVKLLRSGIRRKETPFAVLTADGCWHERGRMGWFGQVTAEKTDAAWKKEVIGLFREHRECIAVACDLHI